jgi:hypothetical protein
VLVRMCKTCACACTCAVAYMCGGAWACARCTFAIARGRAFVFVCMGAVAGLQLCTGPEVRHDKLGGALGAVLELQSRPQKIGLSECGCTLTQGLETGSFEVEPERCVCVSRCEKSNVSRRRACRV